jgi:hypothetical protein
MYETVILLLLTHTTIIRLDGTSNSTMTASPAASFICSILQKNCTMKSSEGVSTTHNNSLSNNKKPTQQQEHRSCAQSPPSPTVPMLAPPSSLARNLVVNVLDAGPMAGLNEEEKGNARKKIAKLLRKEHSIKRIVETNKTLLCGQGNAAIIKMSPERKLVIWKEHNMGSPCEELGIYLHTFEAYPKSHINNTMGVVFVAFTFEDSI